MNNPHHLSDLALERVLIAGTAILDAHQQAHVTECAQCRGQLQLRQQQGCDFLASYPNFESIPHQALVRPKAARLWAFGLIPSVAVAAAVVLWINVPDQSHHIAANQTAKQRSKGRSVFDIAVQRQRPSEDESLRQQTFVYDGQTLYPGDVLAFRYSSAKRYLLVFSVEQTGKINQFIPANGEKSLSIIAGQQIQLPQGIMLDNYLGKERMVAIFSDIPLETRKIRRQLEQAFFAQPAARRDYIQLDLDAIPGEVTSWLIHKEATR